MNENIESMELARFRYLTDTDESKGKIAALEKELDEAKDKCIALNNDAIAQECFKEQYKKQVESLERRNAALVEVLEAVRQSRYGFVLQPFGERETVGAFIGKALAANKETK